MPAHHGVWLHDEHSAAPVPPGPREYNPEQPVASPNLSAFRSARQHSQLLPEGKVLQRDRPVSAAEESD